MKFDPYDAVAYGCLPVDRPEDDQNKPWYPSPPVQTFDYEQNALQSIIALMTMLSEAARKRVLACLTSRFGASRP